ncbi:hypothetical protein H4R18_001792 [Coemansia javaensis]|uniref:Arrestin-like N-terminal domain-containing protein n=1 Tax=Coemansia javaensis TaxID=2761396 RepID=A0A9W8LKU8_9FUNG|nr:hypothetical protein H4R18_001792 [Coemansia javaensis]
MPYLRTSILPAATSIVLRGPPSLAPSQTLSGRVLFRLGHYSLRVRRVVVAFQSVSHSKRQLGPSGAAAGRLLLQEELFDASDLPRGYATWKGAHCAQSRSQHEFPFSFVVPGHLHESVNTAMGSVCYELRVTVHTCGFGINTWTESLRIPVYRVPDEGSPLALRLADSLCMQADWLGAVELQVLGDTVAVADNDKLRMRAVVRPLQKGLTLAVVGLRLIETVRFKSHLDRLGCQRVHDRVVGQLQRVAGDYASSGLYGAPLTHEHSFDLALRVPKAFRGVQYSMDTPEVNVAHELVFTATVTDEHRESHYLRISSPVHIVPRLALESAFSELPAYERSGLDRLLLGGVGPGSCARPQCSPPGYEYASSLDSPYVIV